MDRERLTRLIEEPRRVAREDLADLRGMTERYPWFAAAQVLRLGGERLAGDLGSDETLAMAAAHVPSRAVLFDVGREALPVHDTPTGSLTPANSEITAMEPKDPVPSEQAAPMGHMLETGTAAAIDPGAPDAHGPVPSHSNDQDTPGEAITVAEGSDILEQQVLEAALASAYDLSFRAGPPPPTPPASLSTEEDALNADTPPPPATQQPKASGPVAPSVKAPRSRMRFTEWLAPELPDRKDTEPSHVAEPVTTTSVVTMPADPGIAVDSNTLVDRFISQETPAPTRKTSFFTPQQAAKKSLDDTAGLVTETLARIYAKQGNVGKAVDAYRKLALKYPEKSAYFAALSRELEAHQNK